MTSAKGVNSDIHPQLFMNNKEKLHKSNYWGASACYCILAVCAWGNPAASLEHLGLDYLHLVYVANISNCY